MLCCTSPRGAPSSLAHSAPRSRARRSLAVRAFGPGNELKEGVEAGTKVKVTAPIKVRVQRRRRGVEAACLGARGPGRKEGQAATRTPACSLSPSPRPLTPSPSSSQVYHVPKTAELNIEGMTGTVAEVVKFFKVRRKREEERSALDPDPLSFNPLQPSHNFSSLHSHSQGVELSATQPYRVQLDMPAPAAGKLAPMVFVHVL